MIFSILRGQKKHLWILGILVGSIWHIHIALAPLILLIPIAWLFSKNRLKIISFIIPALIALLFLFPFIFFEARHNFQQTLAFISSLSENKQESVGLVRLEKVIDASSIMMLRSLINYWTFPPYLIYIFMLISLVILRFKKALTKLECLLIFFGLLLYF